VIGLMFCIKDNMSSPF